MTDASGKLRFIAKDECYTPDWVSATILPILMMLKGSGEFVEPFAGPKDFFGTFLRKNDIDIKSLPEAIDFFKWVKSPEVISYPISTLTLM